MGTKSLIKIFTIMFVLMVVPLVSAFSNDIIHVDQNKYIGNKGFLGHVPNRFIVVLKDHVAIAQRKGVPASETLNKLPGFHGLLRKYGVTGLKAQFRGSDKLPPVPGKRNNRLSRYYKVAFDVGTLDEAMAEFEALPDVERVEPIGIHTVYAEPNDDYYDPYQTYHYQANDHDMDTDQAWDIETGSDQLIVAILDSGVRYYHPDLGGSQASVSNPGASLGNMWINWAEKNGVAGVDDDGNGYVDDWIGYDFINGATQCWPGEDCNTKDNDPRDFNGHGTHTAGVVGMISNDGYGMAGTAGGWGDGSQPVIGNGAKIMALRMGYSYNYLGQEYGVVLMDAAAEAFYYAADNGAKIASCSWGSSNSGGIADAIDYFLNNGGMIFVAAGNAGDQAADYMNDRDDVISVAAVDANDNAASFTTYGTWVDICAPGDVIYSTYHDHTDPNTNYWAAMSGTSMATPLAAGVAALIWSRNPGWTAAQVETQLFASSENIDEYLSSGYIGKMGAGRVNAFNAVNTNITDSPVADFSGTPTSGIESLTVNFTDGSVGVIDNWSWNFGDYTNSEEQNPSHTYTSAGSYTVSLTVTGPDGSDTETKIDYITVDPCDLPAADFSGSPTSGEAPLTVDFTDASTPSPTSWSWNFGDGTASTSQNPSHTYTEPGIYSVSLTAGNVCGSHTITNTDYITVTAPGISTRAYPRWETTVAGSVGDKESLEAIKDSDDVYETITEETYLGHPRKQYSYLEHQWEFDLGSGSDTVDFHLEAYRSDNDESDNFTFEYSTDDITYLPMVTVNSDVEQGYSFSIPGDLKGMVYVRVTDTNRSWGMTVNDTIYIDEVYFEYVAAPATPTADFTADLTSGSDPLSVEFTDLSTGNPTSWSWDFGDGSTSTEQHPSYQYTSVGTYTVSLVAGNAHGSDTLTRTKYITVTEPPPVPSADFTATPASGDAPLSVYFTDTSTGSPTFWSWTFGDESTSTLQNPSHTYSVAGTYTVSLEVSNVSGTNTETKIEYITVNPPSGFIHVAEMFVGRIKSGPYYSGVCTVTIQDQDGNPVPDATVYVTATGPTEENFNKPTGDDGTVYFETAGIKKPSGVWCFEVISVTHESLVYDTGKNIVISECESE